MLAKLRATGCIAAATASLLALPAAAQFGAPTLENAPVMEELIARAYGGPPMWKVSDRDSTVYILASPGPLPPGIDVDLSGVERRLAGANQVILPPTLGMGPMAVFMLPGMLGLKGEIENKAGKDRMEPSLTPEQRTRFVAAREKVGQPASRYGALQPGAAAMMLAGDAELALTKGRPKTASAPGETRLYENMVRDAAVRRKVRSAPAARYGAGVLADGLGELRRLRLMPCFETALANVEQGRVGPEPPSAPNLEVLRAWADGDIRPLVQQQRAARPGSVPGRAVIIFDTPPKGQKGESTFSFSASTGACTRAMPTVGKVEERWVADETAAIVAALRRKGHAVAVLETGSLLRQNGVLDRLRRQGFTVTPPAGVE